MSHAEATNRKVFCEQLVLLVFVCFVQFRFLQRQRQETPETVMFGRLDTGAAQQQATACSPLLIFARISTRQPDVTVGQRRLLLLLLRQLAELLHDLRLKLLSLTPRFTCRSGEMMDWTDGDTLRVVGDAAARLVTRPGLFVANERRIKPEVQQFLLKHNNKQTIT